MIDIYIYITGFFAILVAASGVAHHWRLSQPILIIAISALLTIILLTPIIATMPR